MTVFYCPTCESFFYQPYIKEEEFKKHTKDWFWALENNDQKIVLKNDCDTCKEDQLKYEKETR